MGRWVFEGVEYATRGEMCAARRRRYAELLETGMNFTQAARAVGVSKRTGKVWRNGRTRSNGRNEKPSVDWYRSTVDIPQKISSRYLDQDERISIADWRKAGMSVRGIARRLNLFLVKSVFRVSSLIFFGFRHEECRPVVCFTGCPSCRT